jgi:hypothetical protein
MERIIKPAPPLTGGGAESMGIDENTYGTANSLSTRFDGPPSEDFLQTVTPSTCRSVYNS